MDAVVHSFSFLCSIPLDEYTMVSWSILCLLLVKHLDCFQIEAITNNMAMEILVQIFFVFMYTFLFSICPGVNFLVHGTYLYSTSIITAKQFSEIVISICVTAINV